LERPVEHPALREAYAREAAAVRLIADLKTRKREAVAGIERAKAARDGLSANAARGEVVTGSDLRRANEAVADAEAELLLAADALPESVKGAYEAQRERIAAEREVIEEARRPFADALAAAEAQLAAAQMKHALAKAHADRLPPEAQAGLDDVLDNHGRDESAAAKISELRRLEQVNFSRKQSGLPLVEWP